MADFSSLNGYTVKDATARTNIASLQTTLTNSLNGLKLKKCTQSEYDKMTSHDSNTLYIIVG